MPVVFASDFPDFLGKLMAGEVPLGGVLFDPEEYAFMEMEVAGEYHRLLEFRFPAVEDAPRRAVGPGQVGRISPAGKAAAAATVTERMI